jgi:hypothetical protein
MARAQVFVRPDVGDQFARHAHAPATLRRLAWLGDEELGQDQRPLG